MLFVDSFLSLFFCVLENMSIISRSA